MPSLSAMPTPPQETILLTERQRKALDTTILRGDTLLTDGYRVDVHPSLTPGLYLVTKPEATLDKATGELIESYEVSITAPSCTCKQFEFSRGAGCKHLRAVLKHIAHCYNLLAPMLVQAGLTVPTVAAPAKTSPSALSCPHCGHGSTTTAQEPGQHVCLKCFKFFDEIHAPEFGAMKPTATATSSRAEKKPAPIKFSTAPVEGSALRRNPPAPKSARLGEATKLRPGRGIPYCQSCACIMSPATCERTEQEGHLCIICGAFQPLGSYKPLKRPNDNYIAPDGQRFEFGRSDNLTADDLPFLDDLTGEL